MKTIKIIGLVIWVFLTISLLLWGSDLRNKVEMQKEAIDDLLLGVSELMDTTYVGEMLLEFQIEIDSLQIELNEKDSLINILNSK